jgi:cephalosporin hydroxylase
MGSPSSYLVKAQQHPGELAQFLEFIAAMKPESYCEIGCKFGGLLWAVAQQMPKGSRLVAVDKPNGPWGRTDSEQSLRGCIDELVRRGYQARVFWGDSTSLAIVDLVRSLAPFDVIFIDANHTEPFVRADFANYGRLAKTVCFHDIGWNQATPPGRMAIEVPKVWQSLKTAHLLDASFREIKCDNGHNGIGILQWH